MNFLNFALIVMLYEIVKNSIYSVFPTILHHIYFYSHAICVNHTVLPFTCIRISYFLVQYSMQFSMQPFIWNKSLGFLYFFDIHYYNGIHYIFSTFNTTMGSIWAQHWGNIEQHRINVYTTTALLSIFIGTIA